MQTRGMCPCLKAAGDLSGKGYIFDCDGTLMDTINAWHEAEDKLMAESGIVLTKEQRDELNSLTLDEAGVFFYENFDVLNSPDEVRELIIEHMLDYYRTAAELNPGAREFVEQLHALGAPLTVLSSSPQSFLQTGLTRVDIISYFKAVVSVEDLPTTKRDKAIYDHMCRLMGTAPADTWFFDDSWYAVKSAHEAGLKTVGVYSKDECGTHEELGRYADLVIDDFRSLL